jgi:anaerobic sulfite reductase subunit A
VKALLENRAGLYRFLSGLFLYEVESGQLPALKALEAPPLTGVPLPGEEELRAGFRGMAAFLDEAGEDALEALGVDYARVFLSAGAATGGAAFPYESLYRGKLHLAAQEPEGEARSCYGAKGLEANEAGFRVPNDHIGLELAFMAFLVGEAREALETGDEAALVLSREEQRRFFDAHLRPWHGPFCRDLAAYAGTAFYRSLAQVTDGFLTMEGALFEGEGEPWAIT